MKMANNIMKAAKEIDRLAKRRACKCVVVWAALALREEPEFNQDTEESRAKIRRVLRNIHKYASTLTGPTSIDEQVKHVEKVCGFKIVWKDDMELSIDDIYDWEPEEEKDEGQEA